MVRNELHRAKAKSSYKTIWRHLEEKILKSLMANDCLAELVKKTTILRRGVVKREIDKKTYSTVKLSYANDTMSRCAAHRIV